MSDIAYENTDRELYREPTSEVGMSYYQPSVHVTKEGSIGMSVGGTVVVMPIRDWHALATKPPETKETPVSNPKENTDLKEQISRILGEPATTTRGQGGLPLHGTVEDYAMYFTKDGKQHLVNQLVELVHQARVDAVEEYKSAQKKQIPIPRGISGKKLTGIVFDESSYIDSGHIKELESKEEVE